MISPIVYRQLISLASCLTTSRCIPTVALVALCLSHSLFAERQPYERYKTIVDRQMFGPPPEGFDPTKPPSEAVTTRAQQKVDQEKAREQEKLKSAIRFSMINMTPGGETAVGFTDSSDAKNPKNYYLKVGESRDGWTVKEADAAASSMTIAKGDIEVSLTIGGDSAKGAGKTSAVSAPGGLRTGRQPAAGVSLRARREQRRAEEQARRDAFDKKVADFEKRQQEMQKAREEEKVREEAERAQREQERETQRQQLLQIQEQLKKSREEREKSESAPAAADDK